MKYLSHDKINSNGIFAQHHTNRKELSADANHCNVETNNSISFAI
jgi:hypothetical protein